MQLQGGVMDVISALSGYPSHQQAAAWSRIPILNEYKRLYPNADPAAVYRRLWAEELPGHFVWSETWQTMQSTTFGSPEEPKNTPDEPDLITQIREGNFGIDFESQGIRARGDLKLAPAKSSAKAANAGEQAP